MSDGDSAAAVVQAPEEAAAAAQPRAPDHRSYYDRYPDVRLSGLDSWWHFTVYGRGEGRAWVGPAFEDGMAEEIRSEYLRMYPDVAASGYAKIDPWWHYCHHGRREGRAWPSAAPPACAPAAHVPSCHGPTK